MWEDLTVWRVVQFVAGWLCLSFGVAFVWSLFKHAPAWQALEDGEPRAVLCIQCGICLKSGAMPGTHSICEPCRAALNAKWKLS